MKIIHSTELSEELTPDLSKLSEKDLKAIQIGKDLLKLKEWEEIPKKDRKIIPFPKWIF